MTFPANRNNGHAGHYSTLAPIRVPPAHTAAKAQPYARKKNRYTFAMGLLFLFCVLLVSYRRVGNVKGNMLLTTTNSNPERDYSRVLRMDNDNDNLLEGLHPDGSEHEGSNTALSGWETSHDAPIEDLKLIVDPEDNTLEISSGTRSNGDDINSGDRNTDSGSPYLKRQAENRDATFMPVLLQGHSDVDAQDRAVHDAIARVHEAALEDPDLMEWMNDPVKLQERERAVEAMVAIKSTVATAADGNTTEGPVRDYGLERAHRSATLVEAVRGCKTLACIKAANERPMGMAKFKFPHFFMIGWQKTATTSLFAYLQRHPQVIRVPEKEPEFFSQTCHFDVKQCSPEDTVDYLKRVLRQGYYTGHEGLMLALEASTHYSRNGHLLAPQIKATFPWIKIVASLREPVSRAISMLVHLLDKSVAGGGCLGQKNDIAQCLLTFSHINGDEWGGPTNYSFPLKAWLDNWPKDQLMVIQYEELIAGDEKETEILTNLQQFLGLDIGPLEGRKLDIRNSRKSLYEGWRMRRHEYLAIIELVRRDSELVAEMLAEKGLIPDAQSWLGNWERIWQSNLDSCDENDNCIIQVS